MMLAQATAAAMAFNLVCTGTVERHDLQGGTREPYSVTMRIDLDRHHWCEGECSTVLDILRVTPTQIMLQDSNEGDDIYRMETTNFIDRVTGAHHQFITSRGRLSGDSISHWEGSCEREPFTGFPVPHTKF